MIGTVTPLPRRSCQPTVCDFKSGFIAFVPTRTTKNAVEVLGETSTSSPVLVPGSALGLLPSIALSSGQATITLTT